MWQQQQFQMQCAVSCDSVQSSMSPRPFRIKSPVQTVTTVSSQQAFKCGKGGGLGGGWRWRQDRVEPPGQDSTWSCASNGTCEGGGGGAMSPPLCYCVLVQREVLPWDN